MIGVVVDMNLTPQWAEALVAAGHDAVHWSACGAADAKDATIAAWAIAHSRLVLTADLDFGDLLARAGVKGPSVVLLRSRDVRPAGWLDEVCQVLSEHSEALAAGALVVLGGTRTRIRVLPLPSSAGGVGDA